MANKSSEEGPGSGGRFNLTFFGRTVTVNMDISFAVRLANHLRRGRCDMGLWALTQRLVSRSSGRVIEDSESGEIRCITEPDPES